MGLRLILTEETPQLVQSSPMAEGRETGLVVCSPAEHLGVHDVTGGALASRR